MKKSFTFLAVLMSIFLLAFLKPQAAGGTTVSISSVEANARDEISVDVSLSGNTGLSYLKLKVSYDATVLTLTKRTNKGVIEGSFIGSKTIDVNPYVLQWTGAENSYDDGVLATLTFKVTDQVSVSSTDIQVTVDSAFDEEYSDVEVSAISGKVTFESAKPTASLYGANMDIGVDIKFQIFAQISDYSKAYSLKVTDLETSESKVLEDAVPQGTDLYKFVYPLIPTEMSKEFKFELLKDAEVVQSISGYSVQVYCRSTKKNYGTDTELMKLLADMLEYGAAAQQFENKYLDKLANDLDWVEEYKTPFSDLTTNMTYSGTGDSGAKFSGAALDLTNVVNIQFVVNATDVTGLKATLIRTSNGVDTEVGTYTVTQGTYVLRTDPIKAYEQDDVYTAVLKRNDTEIMRLSYSIQAYVASYQHTTKYAYLDALTQRLWRYGKSARAYKFGITEDIEN